MTPESLAALAAVSWGTSGLLAGFVTRARPAILVALTAQGAGLFVVLTVAVAGPDLPTARTVLAGLLGGAVGGVGLVWLYQALAGRAVAVAAPVAASGIVIPVLAGLLRGERLGTGQALGALVLVLGLSAVLYAPRGEHLDRRTLRLAAGAALSFGVFYLALDVGAQDSASWVTVFARLGAGGTLAAAALRTRALQTSEPGRWTAAAALAGAVDVAGNLAYATATATGELSVVSLISAGYPAVTVALAALLLHERVPRLRAGGVLATVLGLGLLGA